MKRSHQLQRVTWDQAAVLQLTTLAGLAALGFKESTLRNWAVDGTIHPVAKAPGGRFLYHRPTVIAASEWRDTRRRVTTP